MLLIDDRAHNGEVCSIDLSVSAAGLQGDYWVATGGSDGVCKLYSRNFDNARHHGGSAGGAARGGYDPAVWDAIGDTFEAPPQSAGAPAGGHGGDQEDVRLDNLSAW